MNIFISVVSHDHKKIIEEMSCLPGLAKNFKVVLKSNKEDGLDNYCNSNEIYHINKQFGRGFGENNNIIFQYCIKELNMNDDDFFIILNPDCHVSVNAIESITKQMQEHNHKLVTINLFKDFELETPDNTLRKYPSFLNFIMSFLGLSSSSVVCKKEITEIINVDWAHGAFLAFNARHYKRLSGFDERYFMYCEDADICLRSSLLKEPLFYYPSIHGVHLKQESSKRIFSKFFLYHVQSVLIFIFRKNFVNRIK